MKKRFGPLLVLLAIDCGLKIAEAQLLPIRVGYTALAGSFSPLWMAKELDLFERHGIQSSPIYMASTLAYQAMLAGETDFTVGASIPAVQARLGGADPVILVTYISGFTFSVIARPPIQQPGDLKGKRIGVTRFGAPTDFGARIALKRWGLVPLKDVTIIQLGGLPEAFLALRAARCRPPSCHHLSPQRPSAWGWSNFLISTRAILSLPAWVSQGRRAT